MRAGGSLAKLFALAAIWGSSYLWIKLALHGFSPIQLVSVRVVLGAVILLIICRALALRLPRQPRIWGHLVVAAFFGNAVPFTLFAVGEQSVDSALAGVLNSTMAVWTAAFALLVGMERRLTSVRAASLVIGFSGAVVVLAPWQADGLGSLAGALICLGAPVCYAVAYLYIQAHLTNRDVSPIALAAAQLTVATILVLLAVPFAGLQPVQLHPEAVFGVLVLGVGGTGLAYLLNYQLISAEGASFVSLVGYLIPVVAVVLGALVLNEQIGWNVLAGTILVLTGVGLGRREPARRLPISSRVARPAQCRASRTPAVWPVRPVLTVSRVSGMLET